MTHPLTPSGRAPSEIVAAAGLTVGAPDFILPWLDRFYDEDDAALILAAAEVTGDAGTQADGAAARSGDRGVALEGLGTARLERAVRRAVLDVDDAGSYAPADFHARLEIWAMFEGWKDVPLAVHRKLADWDVDYYAEKIRDDVGAVRDGRPGDSYEARYSYVLLTEAEAIVAAQEHVYLWPCDCRSIVGKCRKPMDVCLRFENDRGLGWEISRERAVEILRKTDKAGLMHTADLQDEPKDTSSICNCCTDCCYPHLAARRLESEAVWPVRRHVAFIDMDVCKKCGRCGLRCPFDAIECAQDGRPEFEPSLCRGCGLCATGCSAEAIELRPLDAG
jgi:Pyruvate/2-oxoacid:ferredoxin oxidoreductase delta subunit